MFMHGGWMHLIGNLLMLIVMGPAIEDRWGRLTYGGAYVFSGLFAAGLYMAMAHDGSIPMVGASGAIAGVLGAFVVRLWKTKIKYAYFLWIRLRPIWGTFEAAAWVMLPLWFLYELAQALVADSVGISGGVAYWAHVGGFIGGVGAAGLVKTLKIEENIVHPSVEAKLTVWEATPDLEAAMEARTRGDDAESLAILTAAFERRPDEDVCLALWDAAVLCNQPEAGAAAITRAIREAAKRGDMELALRHWSELSDRVPTAFIDPGTLLRLIPQLLDENQKDRAVLALRQAVHPDNTGLTPGLAMRIVEVAKSLDPASALAAAQAAIASPDLHDAKRPKLQSLITSLESRGVAVPEPRAERTDVAPVVDELGSVALARFGQAKLTEARPVRLEPGALHVVLEDEREAAISFAKIQAIAVAAVADQGPKPVLLIDLLANWNESEAELLRGVRLRSNRFDPRKLLGDPDASARIAFARFVAELIEACQAVPVPDREACMGKPFARYDSIADYERELLEVGHPLRPRLQRRRSRRAVSSSTW
jgi:hypothetical protein